MVRKEFIQMRRDRITLGMMVGLPAVQLALFGYAIRTEVRHLPTVIMDESRSVASRSLVDAMRNTGNFAIVGEARSRDEIRLRIESGEVRAALIIPPDFANDLKRGKQGQAQNVSGPVQLDFSADLPLKPGNSTVVIIAREDDDLQTQRTLVIHRKQPVVAQQQKERAAQR